MDATMFADSFMKELGCIGCGFFVIGGVVVGLIVWLVMR